MDTFFQQAYTIESAQADPWGRCKLSVLLRLAQEAAGGHCDILHLDWDTMAKKGLFWAVIRTRVQISRLPESGETVTVKTWPMPTTRTAYPRAVSICDDAGNVLAKVHSLWVLMDIRTRAMVLPGKSGVEVKGQLLGSELPAPSSIAPKDGENVHIRRVCDEDLDRNGHMNNARYLDWVEDLLPDDFRREHPVREFTICYLNEAKETQEIAMHSGFQEGNILQVDGYHRETEVSDKKTRVFSVQLLF